MAHEIEPELGTEELEKGMRPGRARDVGRIGLIAVALLLVINSGGLAKWTESLPSTASNAWIAERAFDWHELMKKLGPAVVFERIRDAIRPQ